MPPAPDARVPDTGAPDGGEVADAGPALHATSLDAIARAAVYLGSCVPDDGVGAFARRLHDGALGTDFGDNILGCEGRRLRQCTGNAESVVDCARRHAAMNCRVTGEQAFCGVEAACDPLSTAPRCEGDTIVLCNAGRVERVDCRALGFARCDPHLRRGAICGPVPWLP